MRHLHPAAYALCVALVAVALSTPGTGSVPDGARLQPGDQLQGRCTLGFVLDGRDEAEGRTFVATAAHCVRLGEEVGSPGFPAFGRVVYVGDTKRGDTNGIPGRQLDVALIEIHAAFTDALVADVKGRPGAPSAEARDPVPGDRLLYASHSKLPASAPGRIGFLVRDGAREYLAEAPTGHGDSGGPVLDAGGRAYGLVSRVRGDCCADHPARYDAGPTLAAALAELDRHGFPLRLRVVE